MCRCSWLVPLVLLAAACSGESSSSASSATLDSDGDGIPDQEEVAAGLDPDSMDSDGDGLDDSAELGLGTDPLLADTDADGLADGDEAPAGADPLVPDTDGDRLLDGDEIANGADPTLPDTDDDGYTDFDEVTEGHDPADPDDRIYVGNWPYYAYKDDLNGGSGDVMEVDHRFLRFHAKDQHGDRVELFDFYNSDIPVVIDLSAQWCGPCNAVAAWLDGEPDAYYDQFWPNGPDAVRNGDVYWITVLGQDYAGNPATAETAREWYDVHHARQIPVLADDQGELIEYTQLGWWPTGLLLTPDLKLDPAGSDGSVETVLQELDRRGY